MPPQPPGGMQQMPPWLQPRSGQQPPSPQPRLATLHVARGPPQRPGWGQPFEPQRQTEQPSSAKVVAGHPGGQLMGVQPIETGTQLPLLQRLVGQSASLLQVQLDPFAQSRWQIPASSV